MTPLLAAATATHAAGHRKRRATRADAWTSGATSRPAAWVARTASGTARPAKRVGRRTAERIGPRTVGSATPATAIRPAASTRAAGTTGLLVDVQERPLVVVIAALIEPDRLRLALADDAHHAAGHRRRSERAARPAASA